MATKATTVIDRALARARDPGGRAHARADVLDVLERCQILLFRGLGLGIAERSIVTLANQLVFPVSTPSQLRMVDVYWQGRRCSPARWTQMIYARRDWYGHTVSTLTEAYQCWAPLGTENFLCWPPYDQADNLTIREIVDPTTPVDDSVTNLDTPDEHIPRLTNMVELILLMRGRDMGQAQLLLRQLSSAVGGAEAA